MNKPKITTYIKEWETRTGKKLPVNPTYAEAEEFNRSLEGQRYTLDMMIHRIAAADEEEYAKQTAELVKRLEAVETKIAKEGEPKE